MANKQKPHRRPLSYFEAQDKMRLVSLYRPGVLGPDGGRARATNGHQNLDDMSAPEPDAELEDSELNDDERFQAIARERMRREGRA